jgi:hypothetical protein
MFFELKAYINNIELVIPIHKKLKINNRKKLGHINSLAIQLLGLDNTLIDYPKYIGTLVKKKKTSIKRKEHIRNLFYKSYISKQFLSFFVENIVYSKLLLQNFDILFKQKESLRVAKKNIFYRKKKNYSIMKGLRIYSFMFPTKMTDFYILSQFHSIFYSLLNLQIHLKIKTVSKKEAILYLKQYLLFK